MWSENTIYMNENGSVKPTIVYTKYTWVKTLTETRGLINTITTLTTQMKLRCRVCCYNTRGHRLVKLKAEESSHYMVTDL